MSSMQSLMACTLDIAESPGIYRKQGKGSQNFRCDLSAWRLVLHLCSRRLSSLNLCGEDTVSFAIR